MYTAYFSPRYWFWFFLLLQRWLWGTWRGVTLANTEVIQVRIKWICCVVMFGWWLQQQWGDHSYCEAFAKCLFIRSPFTKINRIHSTDVRARHTDVEHILKWNLLRHPIIYYFTMSRSNPISLSIPNRLWFRNSKKMILSVKFNGSKSTKISGWSEFKVRTWKNRFIWYHKTASAGDAFLLIYKTKDQT